MGYIICWRSYFMQQKYDIIVIKLLEMEVEPGGRSYFMQQNNNEVRLLELKDIYKHRVYNNRDERKAEIKKMKEAYENETDSMRRYFMSNPSDKEVEYYIANNFLNGTVSKVPFYFKDTIYMDLFNELKNIPFEMKQKLLVERVFYGGKVGLGLVNQEEATEEQVELFWNLIDLEIETRLENKRWKQNTRRKLNRRNSNGLTTRQQQKQDTISKVQELKQKGLKQVEVSKELNVNKSTVSRYWNI